MYSVICISNVVLGVQEKFANCKNVAGSVFVRGCQYLGVLDGYQLRLPRLRRQVLPSKCR